MKNKSVLLIAILSIITLFQNCTNDEIILNEDYITVTDLISYCSNVPCYKPVEWDGKEVKVKGHIEYYNFNLNFSYQSYSLEKFRLKDIRNGYFIEVYFSSNDTAIINKILSSNETDMCYIKGIVKSWEMITMYDCTLESKILINSTDDIYFENKY